MSNKYCQALAELRNKSAHELKEVGDQWRTPDNIYWGINAMFGPFVLDLFSDDENAKCEDYYTAEDKRWRMTGRIVWLNSTGPLLVILLTVAPASMKGNTSQVCDTS